ncbi:hypothetical protein PENANT_c201G01235 [Penicillium antarcticum]|uniref:Uncharacterized protein n=1 Tax=Penicillium antarcticum TaxID=416450 RepID=A0A1V6P964_9EURO|nr:hypothetical protein PENANT_c201G01235 [Penicillium antarcticum]
MVFWGAQLGRYTRITLSSTQLAMPVLVRTVTTTFQHQAMPEVTAFSIVYYSWMLLPSTPPWHFARFSL